MTVPGKINPSGHVPSDRTAARAAVILLALLLPLSAVEHHTDRREEALQIRSAYPDQLFDRGELPALVHPGWWDGQLTLRGSWFHLAWPERLRRLQSGAADGDASERYELQLRYRQALGPWFAIELVGQASDGPDQELWLADPEFTVLIDCWRHRYGGLQLELGTALPVGDPQDWYRSHGQLDEGQWGGRLGLRAAGAWRLWSWRARLAYQQVPESGNETADDSDITYRYQQAVGQLAGDHPLGPHWSVGLSIRWEGSWWEDLPDADRSARLLRAPVTFGGAWTPNRNCRLRLDLGRDLADQGLASDEAWVAGLQVGWRW